MRSNKNLKKLLLIGRSGAGKTSLSQALKGEKLHYQKTQGMAFEDFLIDSPGEYAENHDLGAALALYSYEADVVALLIAAANLVLGHTNGQASLYHDLTEDLHFLGVTQTQQGACMARAQLARYHVGTQCLRQVKQTERIGYRRAAFADL